MRAPQSGPAPPCRSRVSDMVHQSQIRPSPGPHSPNLFRRLTGGADADVLLVDKPGTASADHVSDYPMIPLTNSI